MFYIIVACDMFNHYIVMDLPVIFSFCHIEEFCYTNPCTHVLVFLGFDLCTIDTQNWNCTAKLYRYA